MVQNVHIVIEYKRYIMTAGEYNDQNTEYNKATDTEQVAVTKK